MILNVKSNPTKRDITSFALLLVLFFGALGGVVLWRPGALVGAASFLTIAWLISLIFNRESWHLQILGVLLPLLFFTVGGPVQAGVDPLGVAIATWIAGVCIAVVVRSWLKLGRLVYAGWMRAAFPIGWTISHLVLVFTYFVVLTPIGLMMRLVGRDPMQRRLDSDTQTYWIENKPPANPARYFQQF